MNKKTMISTIAIAMAACTFAGGAKAEEVRSERDAKPSGGFLIGQATGKHICLLNASANITAAELEKASLDIVKVIRCPIEAVDAKGSEPLSEKIARAKQGANVAFVVPFVDDAGEDYISYYPSRELCVVNVRALTTDGADHARVIDRVRKQTWRAVGLVLGAGETVSGYSVLRRASTLSKLDTNGVMTPSPEQHNQMVGALKDYGIKMVRVGTYRTACQQGWAPAPTNAVQKAIWDEVHALPTEPIKIKPETKKVRD